MTQLFARQTSPEGEAGVEPGAGGMLGVNRFVGGLTQSMWIATFILFVIWLIALVIAPLAATIGGSEKYEVVR